MSVINAVAQLMAAGGDYQISRSVRLRSSASAYFNRTFGTPTSQNVWTYSGWYKLGQAMVLLSKATGTYYEYLAVDSTGTFFWVIRNAAGTVYKQTYATAQKLRDNSAWYHFVARKTASLTVDFTVNNQSMALTSASAGSPVDAINSAATAHNIGWSFDGASNQYSDGYLTEINFIDGQALTPSSFGETDAVTGVWKPKKYAGTYGTNGFYLNFSDPSAATAAAIGKDYSGNGNNWTPNNVSVTAGATYDSMLDVPTMWADGGNGRGNYATLNPLDKVNGTLSNGNLSSASNLANYGVRSTIAVSSGKFYWEWLIQDTADNHHGVWSIAEAMGSNYVGQTAGSWGIYEANGNKRNNGSYVAYGSAYANGDTGMAALDMDNGKIWWGKNGTWFASGDPAAGSNAAFTNLSGFAVAAAHIQQRACSYNFGQRPFAYTPPTGFKALNTQNLPDGTIKQGKKYFDATTWTGNSASRSIVNSGGMQPDLVWAKCRSTGYNHGLFDAVRGVNKALFSSSTSAEISPSASGGVSAFNSDGFSLQIGTSDWNQVNNNGDTYVGWQWKESVSAGFDIVTWTGNGSARTISHNLGVTPSMFITKRRDSTSSWRVFHNKANATPQNGCMFLEGTQAFTTTTVFNNTAPTSNTFAVGTDPDVNANGATYVAYLFSEVAGFSKFGSYTGNGSADGPFVYLGFRPRYIMVKSSSVAGSNWVVTDTARDTYNVSTLELEPNSSSAELNGVSGYAIDITSNGFKIRGTRGDLNNSGGTYIFAAFAEVPFKAALAR